MLVDHHTWHDATYSYMYYQFEDIGDVMYYVSHLKCYRYHGS